MKKMTILYKIGNSLYVNLTNKCPCGCTFCVRQDGDSVHGSDSLWLEHEPSYEEVITAFKAVNLDHYKEVIFCGYGEPLVRIELVIEVCKYIKSKSNIKIRVNTNGLSDLIHHQPTAHRLEGYVDAVSISLNAPDAKTYMSLNRPQFGEVSYEAVLQFATACKQFIPEVVFTVVDLLTPEQIEVCRQIAESRDIKFRIRPLI